MVTRGPYVLRSPTTKDKDFNRFYLFSMKKNNNIIVSI